MGRKSVVIQVALASALMVAGATLLMVRSNDDERRTAFPTVPEPGRPDGPARAGDEIPPASRPVSGDPADVSRPGESGPSTTDSTGPSRQGPRTSTKGTKGAPGLDPKPLPPPKPLNYFSIRSALSQPVFGKAITTVHRIRAHDDIELYVEVIRPDPKVHGNGPWPAIMEASPYHGTIYNRDGVRILPDEGPRGEAPGLNAYFVPRGYAIVMLDLRGTGRSQGCLDHLGQNDAKDIKQIVEWTADQEWSNGRVALTGHSYPGGATNVAIAQQPRGLVTAVPSAGLASMYDHQFQLGVPYFLQWAGPIEAYEELAMCRHLPVCTNRGGDNFGNDMEYFGCGWQNSAALAGHGQVNGQYQAWHAARDHREGAIEADIPIFMVHGVNDNAARIPAAEWFFGNRFDARDKVWIGQWDHGSGVHPTRRWDQWRFALHAWFDRHLKQMNVPTGPAVEAFLNGERVATARAWTRPSSYLTMYPSTGEVLRHAPGEASTATFTPRAAGNTSRWLEFASAPLDEETILLGLPQLRLRASLTSAQIMHLTARLYSRAPDGTETHASTCAIQPQLRNGIEQTSPVIPREVMDLDLQCFTVAHRVRAHDELVLTIGTTSPHHVPIPWPEAQVTVYLGPDASVLRVPVATGARAFGDVPLQLD